MLTAIRQWVIKTMMKGQTGIVKTLPKKDLVEFNVQITAERLARNGVNPADLKNVNQVENVINQIENRPPVQQGIKSTKSGKVMDMEGNEIKDPKDIIGGKEINQQTLNEELMKKDNPYSDLVNTPRPKTIKEREAEVLARMEKDNKEAVQRIKMRKAKEYKLNLFKNLDDKKKLNDDEYEEFVGEMGGGDRLEAYDFDGTVGSAKRILKDDVEYEEYMLDQYLKGKLDPEDMAQGGRAGFSKGSGLKTLFNFLNENNPMQAYKKYLKSVENRMKAGKELEVAGEVVPVAAGGALITNQMKKVLKKMNEEQKKRIEQEAQEELRKDMEKKAEGGRAGFKAGSGKGILQFFKNMIKPRGKVKFDERKFREGPIDLDFLENIDKKDLAKFIRTRDTGGPGGYGMYENFADMPAGLKAAELIKTIKTTDGGINYKAAELFLGKRLKGNESVDELIQMLNRQEMRADGGRIGYKDGPEIKLFPRARGSQVEQEVGPGIKISERDIDYGITGLLEGDKFFGGASIDKGKVKVDVITPEGDTLFKDTIGKDDAINFILGMGDPKGDKFEIRTDKDLENMQFIIKTSFADGGRIGLKEGSGMNRRSFLKLLGGLASLPIIGKFLKPAKVASKAVKAAPVVSKSTPPAYFFELAESIKKFGRISNGPQERVKIHSMPSKDGKSELMLTENIGTGEMQIKKISKEGDDMVTEVQTMEYTPGMSQADETTQGIPRDQYDEFTEYNSRIYKDNFNEPMVEDGIKVDEIIEEVKEAPSIKKASGGIARMLGE